jgi:adenylate cyclase
MNGPKRDAKLSFRASLLVVLPLLVLSTSGIITLRSWLTTERTIDGVSAAIFREVTRQTASRTRAHLGAAAPTLDVLAALERRAVRARDPEVLPRLLAMLRANPGYSWVSYGDREGAFTAAYRPDATHVRLNTSFFDASGHVVLDERDLDRNGVEQPFRHEDDSHYDPRTRPWYVAAVEAGRRTWLPPYVFFHQGIAGITCAEPQRDEADQIVGVYTVDFDLGALSRFVSELSLSEHGAVFVFTEDGEVMAHPTRATVVGLSGVDEGRITRLEDIDDAPMRAFRAALADSDARDGREADGEVRALELDVDGETYLASVASFEVDSGLRWRVGAIAPESDFLAELQRENRISALIGVSALVFAVLLAVYLANRVAQPLAQLAAQMDGVGRFELEGGSGAARSPFAEIDAMSRALARMKSGLGSFARFVPRDLVRTLLASGHEARLGGEIRTLSIFFSDIAGFTSLAETLPPDELVLKLGGYLDGMTRTIAEGGGTVDKYLGDGIMAFWGAPEPDADHAAHACAAALECQRVLRAMANDPESAWLRSAQTRIGVATGKVLVGNFGTPERMNYTVMGDTANLASRLEGLNKQYGTLVLVDEPTMRAAGTQIIGRPIDLVAVKGKAKGVRVYELLAVAGEEGADAARALAVRCEEALEAYAARDFAKAAAIWRTIESERTGDVAARVMRERAERYSAEPPPEGWDGVFVAKDK